MRLSDDTRFPYPVLSSQTKDYLSGDFNVEFIAFEEPSTGALTLEYVIRLTENTILNLVTSGQATIGCFVRCNDTYLYEFRDLSWPKGRTDFPGGTLLNRVTVRPIIWLNSPQPKFDPGTVHEEFHAPIDLARGTVLAISPETVVSVGQAKLAGIESIFELRRFDDIPEGQIRVDLESDRIGILLPSVTYNTINLLRGQISGQPVVMAGVYLPAVMEVVDLVAPSPAEFEGWRWYQPFMAKCDARGIELTQGMSVLETAQKLLDAPA